MSFPNSGNSLPNGRKKASAPQPFAKLISSALSAALRGQSSRIKTVALWTGANDRTVKNWFSGERAPSGDHFLRLAANCPAVLAAFLAAIHRNDCLIMADIADVRSKLVAALIAIEAVGVFEWDDQDRQQAGSG